MWERLASRPMRLMLGLNADIHPSREWQAIYANVPPGGNKCT